MATKGVVLAAGEGKRMKPVSEIVPKEMIPILGRPFLYYVLRKLAQAKIRDIVIVTSDWKLPQIQSLDASRLGVRVDYAVQKEPLGPAQALLEASPYVDTEHMMVYYGDNLAEGNVPLELLHSLHRDGAADAVVSLREVDDTSRYGIARFDGKRVVEIVEKPAEGREPSRLAAMGIYIMKTERFFQSLKGVAFEYGKEQFPPQYIIRAGGRVASWTFARKWVDMGKPVDMLRASTLISRAPIRCLVLKADSTLYGSTSPSVEAGIKSGRGNELMDEVSTIVRGIRAKSGYVMSSRRKESVQRDLKLYGLERLEFIRIDEDDTQSWPHAYEAPLRNFKSNQVLVIGGDYSHDLIGPAREGMHVLLARGREDISALKELSSRKPRPRHHASSGSS